MSKELLENILNNADELSAFKTAINEKIADSLEIRKIEIATDLMSEQNDDLMNSFFASVKKRNPNATMTSTAELKAKTQDMLAARAANQPAKPEISPEEKTRLLARKKELEGQFDPEYQRSDDPSVFNKHSGIAAELGHIHKMLGEATTPKTAKEKLLAALAEPKNKITHKDVLKGRGVIPEEKANLKYKVPPNSKGGQVNEMKSSNPKGIAYKITAASHAANPSYGPHDPSVDPKTNFGAGATRSSAVAGLLAARRIKKAGGNPHDTDNIETISTAIHGSPSDYGGVSRGWSKHALTSPNQTPEQKQRRSKLTGKYSELSNDEKEKDRQIAKVIVNRVSPPVKEDVQQINELGDTFVGRLKLRAVGLRAKLKAKNPKALEAEREKSFSNTNDDGFDSTEKTKEVQRFDRKLRLLNVYGAAKKRVSNKGTDVRSIKYRNKEGDSNQRETNSSISQSGGPLGRDNKRFANFQKYSPLRGGKYTSQRNTFRGRYYTEDIEQVDEAYDANTHAEKIHNRVTNPKNTHRIDTNTEIMKAYKAGSGKGVSLFSSEVENIPGHSHVDSANGKKPSVSRIAKGLLAAHNAGKNAGKKSMKEEVNHIIEISDRLISNAHSVAINKSQEADSMPGSDSQIKVYKKIGMVRKAQADRFAAALSDRTHARTVNALLSKSMQRKLDVRPSKSMEEETDMEVPSIKIRSAYTSMYGKMYNKMTGKKGAQRLATEAAYSHVGKMFGDAALKGLKAYHANNSEERMDEKAPPGKESVVKALKKKFAAGGLTDSEKAKSYAIAWSQYNREKSDD